jgi:hypothetical protein
LECTREGVIRAQKIIGGEEDYYVSPPQGLFTLDRRRLHHEFTRNSTTTGSR